MPLKSHDEELKNIYKHVKLYPNIGSIHISKSSIKDQKYALIRKTFEPCVSFNTVPYYLGNGTEANLDFPGVQFPGKISESYTMEEFYDDESGFMGNNDEYYLHNSYLTGDSRRGLSPPPRAYRSQKTLLSSMFKIAENGKIVRVDYPSKPTILNDAIIINRAQPGWRRKWINKKEVIEDRIKNKNKYFKYPDAIFPQETPSNKKFISEDGYTPMTKDQRRTEMILRKKVENPNSPRTVVCHISGRKHTWVALDWMLKEFARDTDHIVVVANLPKFSEDKSRSRRSSISGASSPNRECDDRPRSLSVDSRMNPNMGESAEWTSGYDQATIVEKLLNLLSYIALIVPKDITIKVTVEIVIGKTQKIMTDALNVYTPDFFVSGTLKWERTESLIVWKSNSLTDVLCTKFPTPVFVAPARRMWELETRLKQSLSTEAESKPVTTSDTSEVESYDGNDTVRFESSQSSSTSPFTYGNGDSCIDDYSDSEVSDSEDSSSIVSGREKLILFSKKHRLSLVQGLEAIDNIKNDTYMQKQTKRLNYILQSSLKFSLGVEELSKNHTGDEEPGLLELKRVITGGTEVLPRQRRSMLDVGDSPKKSKDQKVSSSRPKKNAIKFASTVNPKDGYKALGNPKQKQSDFQRMSSPTRSLSPLRTTTSINVASGPNDRQNANTTVIRKVRSSNSITSTKSNDSATSTGSTKKKGGFLSFFKTGARSRSTSRRSSSGSESDKVSLSSDSSRKVRSRLFGFS